MAAEASPRDVECDLSDGEGARAGVQGYVAPTRYSWPHNNKWQGLQDQPPQEELTVRPGKWVWLKRMPPLLSETEQNSVAGLLCSLWIVHSAHHFPP